MITTIHIKNIGIIDDIILDLKGGLNVLTGETGAGKTLIIDSLYVISGGRFSKEMIRRGADFCVIEACIFLPKNEMSEDGNIVVSREIHQNGKNLCKINGRLVTVSELKHFMQNIIDIHGQNDNQKLMYASNHINYIDNFVGFNLSKLKIIYNELYNTYCDLKEELRKNYGDEKERQRTIDLLKYQLTEIEEANLEICEEEELDQRRKIMQNSGKIFENLCKVDEELNHNVVDGISSAIKAFSKISDLNTKYSSHLDYLNEVYYNIQDMSLSINGYKENIDFNELECDKICKRIDLINLLKRKYGNNVEEILKYKDSIKAEVDRINNLDSYINSLKENLNNIVKNMSEISEKMHLLRYESIANLENSINSNLQDLEMKNARFKVNIEYDKNSDYTRNGQDQIEFVISTNIGEDYKELTKIASGGEVSRIMLAIKTVLANVDSIPVMVFDEIDTGISGVAAKSVGQKLSKISTNHQIICVTHLATIAAYADHNYLIKKEVINEKTVTSINLLKEEDTIKEIARISTGEITKIALSHAIELRKQKVIV